MARTAVRQVAGAAGLLQRSEEVLGERGAWASHVGLVWPALADPFARTELPEAGEDDRYEAHVEHWAPLVALTFGALGWGRPDVGVTRWMGEGMPEDGGPASLLARWYGPRAAGLVAWSRASVVVSELSAALSDELRLPLPVAGTPLSPSREVFPVMTEGGPDPLELTRVVRQLVGRSDDRGRLVLSEDDGSAVLVLDRYAGWLRALHTRAAELPGLSDGRAWSVDVVVRSVGSLGVYRRSALTGRWHSTCETTHLLGWPALR
ncbi:hypothetical protein FHN55_02820 [Streptomyces sp. NP160]|uniref:hypothetical protein n=1 Tax=Streptomyces sp. NP160 TaxID=2586637 RepID=UPI001118E3B2|nr:hypothetical protein [Streptomyces sp. NP160]TNM69697.1 hypothetical protein FHN55_02820 [Streptomyces sp. NP160]